MSRKDFRLIAETIRLLPSFDVPPLDSWGSHFDAVRFDALVNRFADALATTNQRFNRERFIAACNGRTESRTERLASTGKTGRRGLQRSGKVETRVTSSRVCW